MRISDWSSDVCSSDLGGEGRAKLSDANNCFNLNSLVAETVPGRFSQRSGAMRQFGELMTLLGIEPGEAQAIAGRSEEHTSELQSLMRISYAVFCLKKKIPLSESAGHLHIHKISIANNTTMILH